MTSLSRVISRGRSCLPSCGPTSCKAVITAKETVLSRTDALVGPERFLGKRERESEGGRNSETERRSAKRARAMAPSNPATPLSDYISFHRLEIAVAIKIAKLDCHLLSLHSRKPRKLLALCLRSRSPTVATNRSDVCERLQCHYRLLRCQNSQRIDHVR